MKTLFTLFLGAVVATCLCSTKCLAFTQVSPTMKPSTRLDTDVSLSASKARSAPSVPFRLFPTWPNRDPKGVAADYPQTKSRLVVTILTTLVTWKAHTSGLCSAVLASSAATLAASLWSPGLGQAAFAGSFAGMSSSGVLTGWKSSLLAASLSAALFEILIHRQNKFLGLGGRLGFVSFLAVNVAAAVSGVPAFAPGAVGPQNLSAFLDAIRSAPLIPAMICGALGSVATIVLRETAEGENSDMADPVRAASAVGIVSALLVGVHKTYSNFGALMAFGGSFTGMSLPSRLIKGVIPGRKKRNPPNAPLIVACYAAAGALGGLVHAATIGVKWWSEPAGWGGKAGTCAFAGVLIFRALEKIIYSIRQKIFGVETEVYPEIY